MTFNEKRKYFFSKRRWGIVSYKMKQDVTEKTRGKRKCKE